MSDLLLSHRDLLTSVDPSHVEDDYVRLGLDRWSDAQVAHAAGLVLSTPKADPATSFILHAPLELLARLGLLRHVDVAHRHEARQWIVGLAATYARSGDGVPEPAAARVAAVQASAPAVASRLAAAVEAGDLDDVDALAVALAAVAGPADLAPLLAGAVLPRLSAAAHATIGLHLFPLVAASGEVPVTVLRGTLRELARYPDAQLGWAPSLAPATGPDRTAGLGAAVAATPRIEPPGSDFIWPTMAAAEASGVVAATLEGPLGGPVDLGDAGRQLLRVAAHSMLQDDPAAAPYGWSHALTMPQAALAVATAAPDPRQAVATAATYLVGFRSTLGRAPIELSWSPEPVPAPLDDALLAGPEAAAAAAWQHAPDDRLAAMATLATWASTHEDAHLVKYVLACFQGAALDPCAASLHLAAAAHLTGWWAQQPS